MITPGERLDPDFDVTVVQDGTTRNVTFRSLLTRPTVVSVYLRNNTGSCDRQNDALLRVASHLDRAGFNLVAVSRDTASSHLKYATKKRITYVLASDPQDLFAQAAGAIVEKSMYGRKYLGPARCAVVLDPAGKALVVLTKVDAATHDDQLRELVAALQRPWTAKG